MTYVLSQLAEYFAIYLRGADYLVTFCGGLAVLAAIRMLGAIIRGYTR